MVIYRPDRSRVCVQISLLDADLNKLEIRKSFGSIFGWIFVDVRINTLNCTFTLQIFFKCTFTFHSGTFFNVLQSRFEVDC